MTSANGKTIMFLDIDGPLLSARMHYVQQNVKIMNVDGWFRNPSMVDRIQFDPVAVSIINKIRFLTDANFVLSTGWTEVHSPDVMFDVFKHNGIDLQAHAHPGCFDIKFTDGKNRALDIREWLTKHPEVDNYVVIDDFYGETEKNKKYAESLLGRGHIVAPSLLEGISFQQMFEIAEAVGITDYTLLNAFEV